MRKQVLALSLGLIAVGSFAQKKELKEAEKALKDNNFASAISVLNSAESLIANADDKYKSKFYFLKGQALAGKKEYAAAADAFNQLFDFEKKTGSNKYSNDARPVLDKMVQSVSNNAVDLYNNKKDYGAAAESFYLTYKLSPKDTAFAFNAAVSATQAKDYDKALEYYKELRKVGYTGVETQYVATNKATSQVESFSSKSQRDLMVKSGQYIKPEVQVSEGKAATIVKNIALILKEQGKTDEAMEALAEARKANPKDLNLLLNEADMYIKLGKMDKFGKLMNEAVALDPNNPTLYYNLGVVNFNQGRVEEAKEFYRKAIELKPDYGDAYMNLAVAVLDKDKAIVEEMNKNLSNFKKYDALALQQKEVYKEALPYLEKADGINRTPDTVRTLMSMYEVLEMTDKAKEYRDLYKSMQ
ncbi:tetratricopeptide repeat protein [Tenacibaculum sp. IB213877]|uniref:tetratricopeptide repeat protein n=1 Tax=Tenacibaculum sp. IB213877 TaxID=3097351 RepID=UPI002A59A758|nr:tetratricopeptide repeat protein [Tenacibaculum sp. IB213877]MDY0779845.1 tetratricopeptide repeat protein [Tenacibaculum sp. IB213877]